MQNFQVGNPYTKTADLNILTTFHSLNGTGINFFVVSVNFYVCFYSPLFWWNPEFNNIITVSDSVQYIKVFNFVILCS